MMWNIDWMWNNEHETMWNDSGIYGIMIRNDVEWIWNDVEWCGINVE